MITGQQLKTIYPALTQELIEPYLGHINKAMAQYQINSRLRVSHFIAQVLHETGGLSKMKENMNYRPERLRAVFPKYFTLSQAAVYGGNPIMIGNKVYADRMGNGNELSGDGYRYRGRGGLHATGKDMYAKLSKEFSLDLISKPELLEQPELAMLSAGYIWSIEKKCNPLADANDTKRITRAINGRFIGLNERIKLTEKALSIIK